MNKKSPIPWHKIIRQSVEAEGIDQIQSWKPVAEGVIISTLSRGNHCVGATVYIVKGPDIQAPGKESWFFTDKAFETPIGIIRSYHSCTTTKGEELNGEFWDNWEKSGRDFVDTLRRNPQD